MQTDRYIIYEMIGKTVFCEIPSRMGGGEMKGRVSHVCRDVLEKNIKFTINKKDFLFKEPSFFSVGEGFVEMNYVDLETGEVNNFVKIFVENFM